ncbi:MAG: 50S ribosomal protein L22 [Syntrophomonadaceae bacterium]|nr:50S ribosomal protein L22 [Syntrophomonadaceae bacterium]
MEARAIARYIRVSPRKARHVVDLIRGKQVNEALAILQFVPSTATEAVRKALRSAIANAENNLELLADDLYVQRIWVDQGPTLKRMKPRGLGRGDLMRRRTSHITVVVGEKKEG